MLKSSIVLTRRAAILGGAVLLPGLIAGCGSGSGQSPTPLPVPATDGNGNTTRSASYRWTSTLLDAISASKLGPPMTARAVGIVQTAIYDAWAAYDPVALGTRLGGSLRRPIRERTLQNKERALSYAAYRVLVDLYPAQKARFDAQMVAAGYDASDTSTDLSTPQGIGNRAAEVLLAFRHDDGSNQLGNYADTTGYVPVNTPDLVVDPSQWQQLRFDNGASPACVAPHWGNVVPFALPSSSAVRPNAPPAFGSPEYRAQAQEIVDLTANLTDEQKVIAEYWADGPSTVLPPGHWQLFGQFVSDRDKHDLDKDVVMFFLLGNAALDAGIACWECKRHYNTSRPITAIRALYDGQQIASFAGPNLGIQIVDGSQWYPYQSRNFVTPPFPEYTSGHSTFSSAAAEILRRFTGSDAFGNQVTLPASWSKFEQNVPSQAVTLSWDTFTQAADQAGLSRRYGGIHYAAADMEGRKCGRLVGAMVWEKAIQYVTASLLTGRE